MLQFTRLLRLFISYCLFFVFITCAWNYETSIYIYYQAKGQMGILFNRQSISEYKNSGHLTELEQRNILLTEEIKKYSVDSLGYLPTENFTEIYDQKNAPILWVITASKPYSLEAYEWSFPVVGTVSYKGFFKKEIAQKEYNHLRSLGYDVDLRSVSAWSTLGWFNDPLLSNMLHRSKGGLCNLLFHELFHATYYAPNNVNFNENIASFIAHKATLKFLEKDTLARNEYLANYNYNLVFSSFMQRQNKHLKKFYSNIENTPNKSVLKLRELYRISDSVKYLGFGSSEGIKLRQKEILEQKNAYFIDFEQYDSMQDSLETAFNKIYKGDLKKLVQDLKQDQTIIKFDN